MGILTDKKIRQLNPKNKLYRVFDGLGDGLYIEILPSGSKKWRQKYRYANKYKGIT